MSVTAPTMDSDFVTLTGSLVDIPNTTTGTIYPAGIYLQNPTTASIVAEVKDASGKSIIPDTPVAPGGFIPIDLLSMPITGKPQWKGNGLVGKFWGWTSWPF